jgi:hypothetical protein
MNIFFKQNLRVVEEASKDEEEEVFRADGSIGKKRSTIGKGRVKRSSVGI